MILMVISMVCDTILGHFRLLSNRAGGLQAHQPLQEEETGDCTLHKPSSTASASCINGVLGKCELYPIGSMVLVYMLT